MSNVRYVKKWIFVSNICPRFIWTFGAVLLTDPARHETLPPSDFLKTEEQI